MSEKPTYEELKQRVLELERAESDRKRIEEALRESERKMKSIFRAAPVGIGVVAHRSFHEVNDRFCEITGYSREELLGQRSRMIYSSDEDFEYDGSRTYGQISKKGIATVDTRLKRKDGKIIDVLVSSTPLDPSNLSAGITFTALDITERKRAEKELRAEKERLRSLSENAPFGMMMISKDGTFKHVNPKFHEIFGYDLNDIPNGKTWFRKAFPDSTYRHQVIASWIEDLASSEVGEKRPRVFAVTCKDGSRKIANFISVQMETGENLTACEDITERRHAEAALRESEKRFRELFNSISDLVYTQDLDGRLLSVNPALCTAFGYSEVELVGRRVSDFLKPELADAFGSDYLERLRKDGQQEGTSIYFTKQGEEIYIEYRSSMVYPGNGKPYISGTGRDVTARVLAEREKRKLQAELNQAQKMEAVGTLAGGIAHNFNNILMGVQGRTSLMLMDKDPAHPDYEHLKGIEEYVRNAVELTKDLLGFARGGKYEVKPTALNSLIEHENRMFSRTKKEISIHGAYEEDLWSVEVDQGQIQQALLNLYLNASQAMPEGGDLYVQTENVLLDEEYIKPFKVTPGKYVKISLTDTGVGMDEATVKKIFDPFFSTKGPGKGSGLGLASVYGIIKNHGGFINVYSEQGQGTTFTLYLPTSEKGAVEQIPQPGRHDIHYGKGTVLLVDDENMILKVGRSMLEKLGYRVITAESGQEALDLYQDQQQKIGLVILDMIMPGMGGGETYDRLKEMDEKVRVLLSSGYSINGQARRILERGCIGFIQKPFAMEGLSRKVHEVLGKAKSGPE